MKPISVGLQGDEACVWAEVDTANWETQNTSTLTLYVIGTGHGAVPQGRRFLGTVIHGEYVWHLYW